MFAMKFQWAVAGLAFIFTASSACNAQTGVIGPDTLLAQESDLSQLPNLSGSVSYLQSSYDRTGGNADFGNYLSTSTSGAVLADMKGPGAVVRIWSANPQGTLKIYIDDNPVPVIQTPFSKLFDNSFPPFVNPIAGQSSGGNYSYLPITYANHCVITTDPSTSLYYQVTYVTFPSGTSVRSFALPLTASDTAALASAQAAWKALIVPATLPDLTKTQSVKPGSVYKLGSYKGSGVITQIRLAMPGTPDADLSNFVLRAYFDGHKTPDIEAPVADFFGNAYGRKPFKTLMLGQATDGSFEADFPMPFAHNATFTLENGSTQAADVAWSVDQARTPFNPAKQGYFHAEWNSELTVAGHPHVWAGITGQQGKFVGIVQTMSGPAGLGFLEGDDQVRVDDQIWTKTPQTPSTVIGPWNGTGTEDCFNSGWYFSGGLNALPMNGVFVRDDAGQIDCYRWFINDAPTFQSSLDAQIEHGGENDAPNVYYSSVAYWYSNGQRVPLKPFPQASDLHVPAPAKAALNLPNAIEGEKMSGTGTAGNVSPQYMASFGKFWSNNAQMFWNGAKVGDCLSLTITPPAAGTFDLVGYFTKAADYGQVSFQVNGQPVGTVFDGYNNGVEASGPIDLGDVTLPAGQSTFKVTITGKNDAAANTFFGLDALCFNPTGSKPVPLPSN